MGLLRDLTGLTFGKLTVVHRVYDHPWAKKRAMWLVSCSCGGKRTVEGSGLFKGKVSDCGSAECVVDRRNYGPSKTLVGQKFVRLLVVSQNSPPDSDGQFYWECRCDCGNVVPVRDANLRNGNTKSCGCLRFDVRKTHGLSKTSEYRIWNGIKKRCYNPKDKAYSYYGGRGIKMCQSWLDSFEAFLADVGKRPGPEYSIDRINSDGDYEPTNVKWATPVEQWANRKMRALSFAGYQNQARETAVYSKGDKFLDITYCILGLSAEANEIAGKWSKCFRDNGYELSAVIKRQLIDEMGDTFWFMAQLCSELDVKMEQVALMNLDKLKSRQERGVLGGSGDNR